MLCIKSCLAAIRAGATQKARAGWAGDRWGKVGEGGGRWGLAGGWKPEAVPDCVLDGRALVGGGNARAACRAVHFKDQIGGLDDGRYDLSVRVLPGMS